MYWFGCLFYNLRMFLNVYKFVNKENFVKILLWLDNDLFVLEMCEKNGCY